MKKTDNDFQSFVRNMTEVCIKRNFLPKEFVMDENSLKVLEDTIESECQRIQDTNELMSLEQRIMATIAYTFMRGYAEGKYHGWRGENKE